MPSKKRTHQNKLSRTTAKERATAFVKKELDYWTEDNRKAFARKLTKLLGAHARDTLARAKRRHAVAWDRMLAKGAK